MADKIVEVHTPFRPSQFLREQSLTYEGLKDMLRDTAKFDAGICGCGGIKDAIDISARAVALSIEHDCAKWTHLVELLRIALYRNARVTLTAQRVVRASEMFDLAPEKSVEEIMYDIDTDIFLAQVRSNLVIEMNKEYINDKIEGEIAEAYKRGRGKGKL